MTVPFPIVLTSPEVAVVPQDATPAAPTAAFAALWMEAAWPAVETAAPADIEKPEPTESATATAVAAALLFVPPVRIWQFSLSSAEPEPVAVTPDSATPQPPVEQLEPPAPPPAQAPDFEAITTDVKEAAPAAPDKRSATSEAPPVVLRTPEPADARDNPPQFNHAEHIQPHVAATSTQFQATSEPPSKVEAPVVPALPEANPEMPLHRSGEAREITFDVKSEDGAVVQVRLAADDPGSVHIDIRATEEPVARELNAHAGELLSKLESSGFEIRTEASASEWNEPQHGGHHQRRPEHDAEAPLPRRKSTSAFRSVFEMQERQSCR